MCGWKLSTSCFDTNNVRNHHHNHSIITRNSCGWLTKLDVYPSWNHHNELRKCKTKVGCCSKPICRWIENQDLARIPGCMRVPFSKDEMKAKDIEPDAASYGSAINSCRAVLRGLQAQSSVLPTIPDLRPKRRGRRNKRQLLWSHSKMADLASCVCIRTIR